VTIEEAEQKMALGIKVQIREGSAAKNFEVLHPLISKNPEMVMLCTDDSHPDDLIHGFMNLIVKRAVAYGHDLFDVLQTVSSNVISHYNLPVGQLQEGDFADFIVVDNLKEFNTQATYIDGKPVFDGEKTLFEIPKSEAVNQFVRTPIDAKDLKLAVSEGQTLKVIEAYDGDLTTGVFEYENKLSSDNFEADLDHDILKMVVLSRYDQSPVQVAYVKGFQMKTGAFASSIAHDSHNIIAVGANDKDLLAAINQLIENKGGIAFVDGDKSDALRLEIAGLMTNDSIEGVSLKYKNISDAVKASGSKLYAPLMTAAFMSLLVIPKLKLGDKGLFDVEKFQFTDLIKE
jgi:adenine deaminase